jgi:nucleoid-associated protein YgaU
MSVLSFIKDVGASVFGGVNDAAAAEKLLKDELGDKIQNLKAQVSGGQVTLNGNCDSLATKEKAMLLTGNVKGVEKVDGTNLQFPAAAASAGSSGLRENEESGFYEIKKGDTLSHIAKQFYGDAGKYQMIFEANREVIKNADKIYPGQKIRIPKLA